ncbi:hypothetical protein BJX63DRAFT_414522 [Aspergillus granulosus]|uniref:Uncharacterized protein n=1 Tax=Aspergillus granulosus TaxID=176169 RepID=A0ABR4GUQ0_9EURO
MDASKSLLIAGLNFTRAETLSSAVYQFAADRSLVLFGVEHFPQISIDFQHLWTQFIEWLSQPEVLRILTAWWITFTVVMIILLSLGFGPAGVVAGSIAAWFQSFMYGGFTPAGGIFATLTSMAMLGVLMPPFVLLASIIATAVAVAVWWTH